MKKTLLMTGALLALTCGLAFAGPGGLSLAWLDCDGNCGVCPHNGYCPCVNPVVARSKTALRIIELRPMLLQEMRARS